MKKAPTRRSSKVVRDRDVDTMRAEYDFSNGKRSPYAKRYAAGTNVVLLAPDVLKVFPTAESVNKALRALAKARKQVKPRKKAKA